MTPKQGSRRLPPLRAAVAVAVAALAAVPGSPGVAAAAAETVAIVGGRVHTAGAGGTLEGATVLVVDGRIAAVGREVAVPPEARVIDAAGKVVTPGLFDSMTQLGLVEVGAVAGTRDASVDDDRVTAAFRIEDALNPASTLIPVNRMEGLTRAVVAPRPGESLIAGQAAVIHLGDGADLVVRSPVAMVAVLGERGARLAGGSRGAAMLRLREALEDARDFAAHRGEWERAARRDYSLSRLDLEALVPVAEGRVPLLVSAERASDIRAALRLAAELDLDLIVAGAAEGWMVAAELAAAGVPVLVDPLTNLPSSFETLGATLENAARLHAAGVRVALMSGSSHNARNLRQLAGNAVAHGMPWDAALAAVTAVPAELWGVAERAGRLAPGLEADVVVWTGDPLELTTWPEHVFIRGVEVPMESRQTRLRDRYRDLPEPGELPPAYRRP
ncbi:MAG TPA: amidohydrolase family protein [Thermoanaerobaculia bacterium]|nr:amidohydrolase family protein [Thermoanaerobaculia bacterium]